MKYFVIIMALALITGTFSGCGFFSRIKYRYDDADKYSAGSGSVSNGITALEIDWINGSVEIAAGDSGEVVFSETANRETSQDEVMRYWLDGNKLHIKYYKSGVSESYNLSKRLTVTLPASLSLSEVKINTVSAKADISGMKTENISVNTVSGGITMKSAEVTGKLAVNTVSGSFDGSLTAAADELDVNSVSGGVCISAPGAGSFGINTTSGKVSLCFGSAPDSGNVNTVSGSVELGLPESAGFTVKYKSVSGKFGSRLPSISEDGKYVFGDGRADYVVKTTSGNLRVSKYDG